MRSKLVLAVLLFLTVIPVWSQVAPAAKIGGLPLGVGVGVMDYSIDYRPGDRMLGFQGWADYKIYRGLGIEAEGEIMSLGKPTRLAAFEQKSAKGGLIYKTRTIGGFHPYAKGLFGLTDAQFAPSTAFYHQDYFTTYAFGGGLEYRAWRNVYVRADYEYQFLYHYLSLHDLNPNGVTIGATYYLRTPRFHH
jgi:opacity protein-like surface antigen